MSQNINGHKTVSYVVSFKVELVEVTRYVHGKVEPAENENHRQAVVYRSEDVTLKKAWNRGW